MKNDPLVSVIMTVYNTDRSFVRDAIKSVMRQTYKNIELIIVDDASDDPELISYCAGIAEQEAARQQRRGRERQLKLISSKKNYGTYVCRNYAISIASGEYIAVHDSDDTASSLYIKNLYRHYKTNERVKVVYCMTNDRSGDRSGVICAVSSFFKKTLVDEMGYFDSVRFAADSEFRLRCQRLYGRGSVSILNKVLYDARSTRTSLTGREDTGFKSKSRIEYAKAFKKFHKTAMRGSLKYPFPVVKRQFVIPSVCETPLVNLNDFVVVTSPHDPAPSEDTVQEGFFFEVTAKHKIASPPAKIDLDGIDTLYVVKRTAKTVTGGSGYTVRTGHVVRSFNNVAVVLNPEIGFNHQHLDDTIDYADGVPHLYFNKKSIYKFIKEQGIKRIILPSDAENFLSFQMGLNKHCRGLGIKLTYEMRGLWYLSGQANVMQRSKGKPSPRAEKRYWKSLPLLEMKAVKSADSLVFITNELKEYVIKKFNNNQQINKPHVVIPNGYEPEEPYKRQDNTFTIGYFGSISPYEGIDMLIDACKEINHGLEKPIVKLHLVGNWKNKKDSDIEDLSFVKHEEWKPKRELGDAYKGIDLFCIPRLPYDVCQIISPLKPFHSLYNKVPLLMADTMCLKDIAQDGKNCLLFKSGDVADLKTKILKIKDEGYPEQLLENGRKWIIDNRRWDDIRSKYNQFVEEQ